MGESKPMSDEGDDGTADERPVSPPKFRASTVIQSWFRGIKARKKTKKMKNQRNKRLSGIQPVDEEEFIPKDPSEYPEQEIEAAKKIQSAFRIRHARKEAKRRRKERLAKGK